MGEAKRRKMAGNCPVCSDDDLIKLTFLSPVTSGSFPSYSKAHADMGMREDQLLALNAFKASFRDSEFLVGFCVGDGQMVSQIGMLVMDRLLMESPKEISVRVIKLDEYDIAWDIVLRDLKSFNGSALLFAFADSEVYDAGTAEIFYSKMVEVYDGKKRLDRPTKERRDGILKEKEKILGSLRQKVGDEPKIFTFSIKSGRQVRITVWNGRKDFIHEMDPLEVSRLVGGERIAMVQVGSPVGINGRSSVGLTEQLAESLGFDGIVHWARDTETYKSIISEFVEAGLSMVEPPQLSLDWKPEIVVMPVRD